jgi:hypothetical protein
MGALDHGVRAGPPVRSDMSPFSTGWSTLADANLGWLSAPDRVGKVIVFGPTGETLAAGFSLQGDTVQMRRPGDAVAHLPPMAEGPDVVVVSQLEACRVEAAFSSPSGIPGGGEIWCGEPVWGRELPTAG